MEQTKTNESKFSGKLIGFTWVNLVYWASVLLTANLLMPFGLAYRERYMARHTVINGKQLEFFGSGTKLFIKKLVIALISPILLGAATTFFLLAQDNIGGDGGINDYLLLIFSIIAITAYVLFTVYLILRLKRWVIKHTRFKE